LALSRFAGFNTFQNISSDFIADAWTVFRLTLLREGFHIR
jgi:hypothetical protein